MSISERGEVKQRSQNVSDSPVSVQEKGEKGLKNAIFNSEKLQNTSNNLVQEPLKAAENRRFSFNSDGRPKTFFKISSAISEKKDKAENFNDKEKEESLSDELEKNSQHEEISYDENIDEVICGNNKDCCNKESKSSVNKIFTTPVIEKRKKSINFKVIKNRERFNSTNTVNSVNLNSIASNNNSNNNTACNTNVNKNPLNSNPNPCNNDNNYNNVHNDISNNLTSDLNLNNVIISNSTSSNSVVVNNLNSITNLNLNSNLNLQNNNKINYNNNSINTHNSNPNCNQLNSSMDDLNFYNKNLGHRKIRSKQGAINNLNSSNIANLDKNKENINSFGENQIANALIENNNYNNFNINNNLNNPNMKNSKNNMNAGKQQVFDLNNLGNQNGYMNAQSNYNHTLKNIQNPTQLVNASNMNAQLQFFGNANPQEFFNDSSTQSLNANAGVTNQNMRSYAQQNYTPYQPQNYAFYEKENLAAAAAQNFNSYYPTTENFNKKRNKENEENLNFNSLYLNSANFGSSVAMRQQSHNMYPNAMPQSYLNPYSHQYNANLPYGVPGINAAFSGSAVAIGMNGLSSPARKPLRCKENYIEELLVAVEECISRGIYRENSSPAENQILPNGNHENKSKTNNSEPGNPCNNNTNEIANPFSNKEPTNNINNNNNENDNNSFKNYNDKQPNNNNKKSNLNKAEKEQINITNNNSSSSNKQNEEKQNNSNNNPSSKLNSNDDSSICQISEKNNNHKKSPSNDSNNLKNNLINNLDTLSNNLNLDLNENNKSTPDDDINSNASSKHSKNDRSSVKKNEESFIDFSSLKENKKGNNGNHNGNNYSSLSNNGRANNKQRETNTTKCENKYCQFDNNSKKKQVITKKKIGSKSMLVCQNCLKAYNNGKFCRWCLTTYKENTSAHEDGKDWVQCDADNCISWHHIHCEERKGNYSNLTANLKDKDFKYYCPDCKPKFDNNTPMSKSRKVTPNDSFLKKKRAAVKSNSMHNVYRKEYDFAFKHSKSKRIKEKMKQLEKIKDKDKSSDKDALNSPSNPNTRNFTSLGRTEKNRNNPSSSRDGELIKRSRTKHKGSSKSLNCNLGNSFNNFNDLFVYDQRLKTTRNRADSSLMEDDAKDIGSDIKKLNDKLNKEN